MQNQVVARTYQLIIDAGASKRGAEMFAQASSRISDASQKAAAAGKPLTDTIAGMDRAYAQLVRRIDPVVAAEQRMAKEINIVAAAFRNGSVSIEEAKLRLDQINARFERTANAAQRLKAASTGGMFGNMFGMGGMLGQAAGLIGTGYIARLTREAIDAVGGLGELSSQIGVTSDTLQAFGYAATQVGLKGEEMNAALSRLTRTIGDAAEGNKAAITTFETLGVGILDAAGNVRPTEDVLRDVADALQRIDDPARRASLAVDLFGKAGQKMMPFLENGSRGIDDLTARAKELGLVFDTETIAQADAAADAIASLGVTFDTLGRSIAVLIAGPLGDFATWFEAGIPDAKLFFDTLLNPGHVVTAVKLNNALDDLAEAQKEVTRAEADFAAGLIGQRHLDKARADVDDLKKSVHDLGIEFRAFQAPKDLPLDPGWQTALGQLGASTSNPTPKDDKADKEVIRDAAQVQAKLEGLRFTLEQLSRTEIDQKVAENLRGIKPTPDQAAEIEELTRAIVAAQEAAKAGAADLDRAVGLLRQGAAEYDQQQAQIARLYEATRTPAERYAAEVQRLNDLLGGSAENSDLLNRALAQAEAAYERASTGTDRLYAGQQALEGVMTSSWQAISGSIVANLQAGEDGFRNFGDVALNALNDIMNKMLEMALINPFENFLTGSEKPVIGDIFGAIFAGAGSLFGSGGNGGYGTVNLFGALTAANRGFASGGIMTPEGPVPLHRYARGGIANTPQLAMFGEGAGSEAYVPLPDGRSIPVTISVPDFNIPPMPAAAYRPPVINIIDQRSGQNSEPVQTRRRQGAGGIEEIDVLISDRVDRAIQRGRFDDSLGSRFNVIEQPRDRRG